MRKVLISSSITLIILLSTEGFCQNSTDHFRSRISGLWDHASTWESSSDGENWQPATSFPSEFSNSITIRSPHTVTHGASSGSADQLTILQNAILDIQSEFKINDGEGNDLIVYGTLKMLSTLDIEPSSIIVIQNGGKYLANISKNNKIYPCIWESGSTLQLEYFGTETTILGLSQSFGNVIWKGSSQENDISLNLNDEFYTKNNFTVQSTNSKDLILTSSVNSVTLHIDGNLDLKNQSYMRLSSGTGPVTMFIGGNMYIGSTTDYFARLVLGTELNSGNIINLKGNLIVLTSGGINPNDEFINGAICFNNTSMIQNIQNIYDKINRVNYVLNEDVSVNSPLMRVDPGYTLKLHNNASLITSNDVESSIEQTLSNADWNVAKDGWHLISSPVSGQSVSVGGFTWPLGDPHYDYYDFYAWSEPQNQWLNQKVPENGITTFIPGTGYLAAYDEGGTKTYTGTLNNTSIPLTNLSFTGTAVNGGYHLLGNPFPCALDWSHNSWLRNNVSLVASVWNETAGNYLSISDTNTNCFIPSNQGFFVQVLGPINSLVIPVEAKVHNNQNFYKHTSSQTDTPNVLYLQVSAIGDSTYDETIIRLQEDALPVYDLNDGHKLIGSDRAPQLYTEITPNEYASVNSFPVSDPPETVPLFFRPGFSDSYVMEVLLNSMEENVFLEDLLTGQITPLNEETVITFSASPQDNLHRFLLHLGPVGVPEVNLEPFSVYSYGRSIYIRRIANILGGDEPLLYRVLSITGSILAQGQIASVDCSGAPVALNLPSLPPGIYLISLTCKDSGCSSKKIVIF